MSACHLREAEKIEVTAVFDNYISLFLLYSDRVIKRIPMAKRPDLDPVAEHGLSLISIEDVSKRLGKRTVNCLIQYGCRKCSSYYIH